MFHNIFFDRGPFAELERMQRELESAFGSVNREFGRFGLSEYPPVNLYEGDDDLLITAHIPGVESGDLDITAVNDVLTIKGSRPADCIEDSEEEGSKRTYHRQEIVCGEFVRSLKLPDHFDPQNAKADLKNGVLSIVVPRKPESKPMRLTVNTG